VSRRLGRDAPASSVARAMLGRLDRDGTGMQRARVVSAWRSVAGEEVFSHARGFALRGEELVVFVDTGVWANELSAMSGHYRDAVNIVAGKEAVTSLRFAVSRKVAEERAWDEREASEAQADELDKVEPVPATTAEVARIRQMASGMRHDKAREAVIAAAIRNLEWRKGIEARKAAENASQSATEHDSY
jgi:hypothetical protein